MDGETGGRQRLLADYVRKRRLALGRTAQQVADLGGPEHLTKTVINRIESGLSEMPRPERLVALARGLSVDHRVLVDLIYPEPDRDPDVLDTAPPVLALIAAAGHARERLNRELADMLAEEVADMYRRLADRLAAEYPPEAVAGRPDRP